MDFDFQILEENFPDLLSNAPLSHQKAAEVEASLSEALANIANTSPSQGLERLKIILDDVERSDRGDIDPKKLMRVRQMIDEYGDSFFNEFWAKQFMESSSIPEINDTGGSESRKVLDSEGEVVSEEELSLVPPEATDQVRQFLRKLELLAIFRKKKFKEQLGNWKELAVRRVAVRSEKQWKIFGCFTQVFLNKQKALFELRKKSAQIGGDFGDEDYWRKRFLRPLRDGIQKKHSEIDRLKQDLDDIEAENVRLSMQGTDWKRMRQSSECYFSQGWWRQPQYKADQQFKADNVFEKVDDDFMPMDTDMNGEDNFRNPLFETGNIFKKLQQFRDAADLPPRDDRNVASSMVDYNRGPGADPFDPQMTQILPDPSLKTQRLDTNISMSYFNDDGTRERTRKDSGHERIEDANALQCVVDSIPPPKSAKTAGMGLKLPTIISEATHDDVVMGGLEVTEKLSWLKRSRLIDRLFRRLQKERVWGAFCRIISKCRASKIALNGASSRMMAKLLLAARQNLCGQDLKKDFRRWYVAANPHFAKECVLKLASRLPIRFQYVIFRMKYLVYKGKTKVEPLQKVVHLSRGLGKLTHALSENIRRKVKTAWKDLSGSVEGKKLGARKLWTALDRQYRTALAKRLQSLRKLVNITRGMGQRLANAAKGRMADCLTALRSNEHTFRQVRKATRVGSIGSAVQTREGVSLKTAWEAIKAVRNEGVRNDALKKKVVLRMVYLSGSQLYQALTALRLHSHHQLQTVFNRKNELLTKLGLRLQANVKANKAKALSSLRAHWDKENANDALKALALEQRKARAVLTLQKNYAGKLQKTVSALQDHNRSLKEAHSSLERRMRQALTDLTGRLEAKKVRCFGELVHFATERDLACRGGLQTLRQLVAKKEATEVNFAVFKLALHFHQRAQEQRKKEVWVSNNLRIMCFLLKVNAANSLRSVCAAARRKMDQEHAAGRTLVHFMASKPLNDMRSALESLRTINLGFKTNSKAVIASLGVKAKLKVAAALSQLRLHGNEWENRRQKALKVIQHSIHLERKALLGHLSAFWHALQLRASAHRHGEALTAHKQLSILQKVAKNSSKKLQHAVTHLWSHSQQLRSRADLEDRHQAMLKLQALKKMKGSILLFNTAQSSKLKSAFGIFVAEGRRLRTEGLAPLKNQHAALTNFFGNATQKLSAAFAVLRDQNQTAKRASEALKERTERVLRRLLGKPLTSDFGQINPLHFDAFVRNYKCTPPLEKNAVVQDLKRWFSEHDWQGVYSPLVGVLDEIAFGCVHLALPKLRELLENDHRLSSPEFEALKNAAEQILADGLAKKSLIARQYELEVACDPRKQNPLLEKLRTVDNPMGTERFECIREAKEGSRAAADSGEALERLEGASLRDKADLTLSKLRDQSEWVRAFVRTNPRMTDICLALKAPKYKADLSQVGETLNRKQDRHFQRLMCLISAFLEVYNVPNTDMFALMHRFGATDTSGLLRLLDQQIVEWPFAFHTLLVQAANQNFGWVPFENLNAVIRSLAEGDHSKLGQKDMADVVHMLSVAKAVQPGGGKMSQVDLFVLLCKKKRLRRLTHCMLAAFHLEGVFGWDGTGPLECPESLVRQDGVDIEAWGRSHPEKHLQMKVEVPDTFEALVRLTAKYQDKVGVRPVAEFLEKIRHEKYRLSKVSAFLGSESLQPSSALSMFVAVLNEKNSCNPLLDLVAGLATSPRATAFRRLLNRVFHGGRPMDLTDFVILLQQTDDKTALKQANGILGTLTESSERRELIAFITQDRDCQEIREGLNLLAYATLGDVVSLTNKMKNAAGIRKIRDKINSSLDPAVCCQGGPDMAGLSEEGDSLHEIRGHKKTKSLYEFSANNFALPTAQDGSVTLTDTDQVSFSPFIKKMDTENMQSVISVSDLSLQNAFGDKETEFFGSLDAFLKRHPTDRVSQALKDGKISQVSHLKDHLLASDAPQHTELLRTLESGLPLRIPERRSAFQKPDSLLESKVMKRVRVALKALLGFAKDSKNREQNSQKARKQVLLQLKKVMRHLLGSSVAQLRKNTGQIASEAHLQSRKLTENKARLIGTLRDKILRKQTFALDSLRANARHWALQTRPAVQKILRVVSTIERRQMSHALLHIHRLVSAKWAAAVQLSKILGTVERTRDRHAFDTLKQHSDRLVFSQSHLKLIAMLTNAAKAHQMVIRRHFDILTSKKVRALLSQFVAKLEGLPVKRKINAFYSVKAVYYREKYRDRIQGLNALMNLVSYQETAAVTSAMEVFVKKFRKVNPWFDRIIAKMMFLGATTDQNSFWKMKFLGRMKDTIMKPSESLKLKRLAQIVARGIQKNKSFALFRLHNKLTAAVRKSMADLRKSQQLFSSEK